MLLKLKFLTVWMPEGLAVEDKDWMLLKNIRYKNQLSKQKELIVRITKKL